MIPHLPGKLTTRKKEMKMDKIQRIYFLCNQLDDIKKTMIHIISCLTEFDFMREGNEKEFDYLLKTGWKEIAEYKNLIKKIYLELEATQPAQDFPGTRQEWLLLRKLFLSVMEDVEASSNSSFNLFHALRDLYVIVNDDKTRANS